MVRRWPTFVAVLLALIWGTAHAIPQSDIWTQSPEWKRYVSNGAVPEPRWQPAVWRHPTIKDAFVSFGGFVSSRYSDAGDVPCDSQNDLWIYYTSNKTWVLAKPRTPASHGALGVAASTNAPPSRGGASAWSTGSDLYMFGGARNTQSGSQELVLADLWRLNLLGDQWVWTWIGGSSAVNYLGNAESLGAFAAANLPPARTAAASWLVKSTRGALLFLFGGVRYISSDRQPAPMNDFWVYDMSRSEWMAISGMPLEFYSNGTRPATRNTTVSGATPSARYHAAAFQSGDCLYLFGGATFTAESVAQVVPLTLNDVWRTCVNVNAEDGSAGGQWYWLSGSEHYNHGGAVGNNTAFAPEQSSYPSARFCPAVWLDPSGDWVHIYGGIDASRMATNDMWVYDITGRGQWQFVGGVQYSYAGATNGTRVALYDTTFLYEPTATGCPISFAFEKQAYVFRGAINTNSLNVDQFTWMLDTGYNMYKVALLCLFSLACFAFLVLFSLFIVAFVSPHRKGQRWAMVRTFAVSIAPALFDIGSDSAYFITSTFASQALRLSCFVFLFLSMLVPLFLWLRARLRYKNIDWHGNRGLRFAMVFKKHNSAPKFLADALLVLLQLVALVPLNVLGLILYLLMWTVKLVSVPHAMRWVEMVQGFEMTPPDQQREHAPLSGSSLTMAAKEEAPQGSAPAADASASASSSSGSVAPAKKGKLDFIDVHMLEISLAAEVFLESVPQLIVQVVNNVAMGNQWDTISIISLVFSSYMIFHHVYSFTYRTCVKRNKSRPQPSVMYMQNLPSSRTSSSTVFMQHPAPTSMGSVGHAGATVMLPSPASPPPHHAPSMLLIHGMPPNQHAPPPTHAPYFDPHMGSMQPMTHNITVPPGSRPVSCGSCRNINLIPVTAQRGAIFQCAVCQVQFAAP